jgi:signal transduction histidine kinase
VAVEYAERRSNFVAAVSHELKTPLTAIRMYGEMLRDGVVPSESKRGEYYATITDEAERLSRLINNVLEFSKLEKGHGELALVVGDVADVVREAAGRLAPHAERAGFALRVEAEDGMPPVRFDRDALLQVLFNLVDNAIKYAASAARREIVLAVTRSGDDVAVSVRDFGPGVPRGELRRVFEPFHRGGHELTRRAKGTGIGLALVRELAAAMRARVQGDTPEDGGFRVRLVFGAA